VGIITTGVSYLHSLEAMEALRINLPILKLGFFYPLPNQKIKTFLKGLKKVLVVEELDGYIEKEIKALAKGENLKVQINGQNVLTEIGELNAEKIAIALAKVTKKKFTEFKFKPFDLPRRTARLCEGCPYWFVFPTLKRVAPDAVFTGDIGCNMIAGLAPHSMHDYLFSMGASLGISHGVKKSTNQKVISIMGDGTFFHSGIAGLINAVYNKSNPLVVILDNRITAMTGHQPNPGMGRTLMGDMTEELSIEEITKACGVKNVKVLDPINMQDLENTVKDFLAKDEISVIICKKICALLVKRQNNDKHEQ
jgi:indolepyruvate ferredoxin oxidoreductase alpha subunit